MALSTAANSLATYYSQEADLSFAPRSILAKLVGLIPTPYTPDVGFPISDGTQPVMLKAELLDGNRGRTVSIPKITAPAPTASTDNLSDATDLQGNETAMSDSNTTTITAVERGRAVAWRTRNARSITYDMRQTAKAYLDSFAPQKFDVDGIELAEAGTTNIVFSGNAGGIDMLDSGDTLAVIDFQKMVAKLEGQNAVMAGGEGGGWVSICHSQALYGLKQDSTWQNFQRDAGAKGLTNPLFKHPNLEGWIDNNAIFQSNLITRAANSNTPAIQTAKNITLGAKALAVGLLMGSVDGTKFGVLWEWRERSEDDYGRTVGVAYLSDYEFIRHYDANLGRIVSAAITP